MGTAAMSVAGLRQDVTEAWGEQCPCSLVTALVVNACFGGEILRYDLGLRGAHYLNRITLEGDEFCIDLTKDRVFAEWVAPSRAMVCERSTLVGNDETWRNFAALSGRLLSAWGGVS